MSAEDDNQPRLRARGEAAINGIEAELRGDFRVETTPERLSAELQNININNAPTGRARSSLQPGAPSLQSRTGDSGPAKTNATS